MPRRKSVLIELSEISLQKYCKPKEIRPDLNSTIKSLQDKQQLPSGRIMAFNRNDWRVVVREFIQDRVKYEPEFLDKIVDNIVAQSYPIGEESKIPTHQTNRYNGRIRATKYG